MQFCVALLPEPAHPTVSDRQAPAPPPVERSKQAGWHLPSIPQDRDLVGQTGISNFYPAIPNPIPSDGEGSSMALRFSTMKTFALSCVANRRKNRCVDGMPLTYQPQGRKRRKTGLQERKPPLVCGCVEGMVCGVGGEHLGGR